jgi:N-acetylglucosamine kinase-like BadF-type ATPase
MVHTALEQVINEIELNQKAKDLLDVLMKILGYSPEDIKRIIGNKSVKSKKFGFF